MATLATQVAPRRATAEERFFMTSAVAMAVVIVAGFSLNAIMGRSTIHSPVSVHVHGLLFMGFLALYVTQNALVATGNVAVHKRLGWLSAGLVPAMIVAALYVIVAMVRRGAVPFFFTPVYFLVMDTMILASFVALVVAAIRMRRRNDWHRRLMFCGMAAFTGNGLGRLLPMPLLIPYAGEAAVAASLVFPIWGLLSDRRRTGRVHPAWLYGLAVVVGGQLVAETFVRTPVALSLYDWVAAGSPGAHVSPTAYPALPPA
ncbi:MAG: hypothetical protein JOZ90_06430 [Alphaproteobacteria bacterium]|nr:hypothetical protein [Alphaproteobacteria bacterium]MBV9370043.1 hypothetical protein [Alphaproteobacteria bacterium]MBV9900717.1 hypothetical protein [Alphaproteobacteria bacterium]